MIKDKLVERKIKGLKHPISLSNYGPDVTTLFQIFFAGEYKMPFSISPKFILDCGANIGLSAVYYSHTFPAARIIAIEPDKKNFMFLVKNTAAYPNIICLNKAVWSHAASMELIDVGKGNWSLQTKEISSSETAAVKGVSISSIMKEYNQDTIDILKIDIEGAEKELFSCDYENWLSKTNTIAIELHDNLDPEISAVFYNALKEIKYKKYFVGENIICDLREVNIIWNSKMKFPLVSIIIPAYNARKIY